MTILRHDRDDADEHARLRTDPIGRLEWWRTLDILSRHLPGPPATILDAGGGAGAYALPLAADGHTVQLVDAVLVLAPLYHLMAPARTCRHPPTCRATRPAQVRR